MLQGTRRPLEGENEELSSCNQGIKAWGGGGARKRPGNPMAKTLLREAHESSESSDEMDQYLVNDGSEELEFDTSGDEGLGVMPSRKRGASRSGERESFLTESKQSRRLMPPAACTPEIAINLAGVGSRQLPQAPQLAVEVDAMKLSCRSQEGEGEQQQQQYRGPLRPSFITPELSRK